MPLSLPPEMVQKVLEEWSMRCKTMEDVQDFLKQFTWPLLEKILEAEMDIHLGYKKHDIAWYNTWNSRNGNSTKKVRTTLGDINLDIPRDRKWEFQPQIVTKYQSNMNSIEERVLLTKDSNNMINIHP